MGQNGEEEGPKEVAEDCSCHVRWGLDGFVSFCAGGLFPWRLDFVVGCELAFDEGFEFVLHELTTETFEVVGVDDAVEVVEFVLHNTGEVAVDPFVVRVEVFVLVGYADSGGAGDFVAESGEGEAAFFLGVGLGAVFFDVGVDEEAFVAFVLGLVVADDVEVDDGHADREAYLGGCEAYAAAVGEGVPHVLYGLGEIGVVGGDLLGLFLEDGLSVGVDG